MGQKVFIPVTDEILYEHPDLITSPLTPFQVDHPCFRWLSAETEAVDPDTVDIDTSVESVEMELSAPLMNFSPVGANYSPRPEAVIADRCVHSVYSSDADRSAQSDQAYSPFQHVLRKRPALPCKDAA